SRMGPKTEPRGVRAGAATASVMSRAILGFRREGPGGRPALGMTVPKSRRGSRGPRLVGSSPTAPGSARMARCFVALALLLLPRAGAQSMQPAPTAPLAPALRALFHEALWGELAKEHVIAITRNHRIQGSRGYREAARYVIGRLRDAGYAVPALPATPA